MSETSAAASIQDLTGDYELDPAHTRLGFVARHAMVTRVRGEFREFSGRLHVDAEDPSRSTAEVRVQLISVATGDDQRDAHLRNADFFDVERTPEMTFVSTGAERVDEDRFRLTGDLTIKSVTKPVTLDVEFTGTAKDPYGNLRAGFELTGEISRKEWGITWNAALETGGFLVSDKIRLELDVSAVRMTPTGTG